MLLPVPFPTGILMVPSSLDMVESYKFGKKVNDPELEVVPAVKNATSVPENNRTIGIMIPHMILAGCLNISLYFNTARERACLKPDGCKFEGLFTGILGG
jgi:hypothetical protein